MMKMLAGLMSQNNIHASQGHRAALCGVWEKRMQKKRRWYGGTTAFFVCRDQEREVWIWFVKWL